MWTPFCLAHGLFQRDESSLFLLIYFLWGMHATQAAEMPHRQRCTGREAHWHCDDWQHCLRGIQSPCPPATYWSSRDETRGHHGDELDSTPSPRVGGQWTFSGAPSRRAEMSAETQSCVGQRGRILRVVDSIKKSVIFDLSSISNCVTGTPLTQKMVLGTTLPPRIIVVYYNYPQQVLTFGGTMGTTTQWRR